MGAGSFFVSARWAAVSVWRRYRRRRREGWRTEETAYRVDWSGDCVVRPEGLEPPTPRSVDLPSVLKTEGEQE